MNEGERFSLEEVRKRIESEIVPKLQEYRDKYDIWGHGVTSTQLADKILAEGLFVQGSALHDFAYELPQSSDSLAQKLQGWDYNGRRVIILIAAPQGFESSDVGGYDVRKQSQEAAQRESILLPLPSDREGMNESFKNKVPTKKIIGYIDTDNFQVVVNEKFQDIAH